MFQMSWHLLTHAYCVALAAMLSELGHMIKRAMVTIVNFPGFVSQRGKKSKFRKLENWYPVIVLKYHYCSSVIPFPGCTDSYICANTSLI